MKFEKNEIIWNAETSNTTKSFKKDSLQDVEWQHTTKGYQLRIFTSDGNVTTFVGFGKEV
jgi:hypothetical protein